MSSFLYYSSLIRLLAHFVFLPINLHCKYDLLLLALPQDEAERIINDLKIHKSFLLTIPPRPSPLTSSSLPIHDKVYVCKTTNASRSHSSALAPYIPPFSPPFKKRDAHRRTHVQQTLACTYHGYPFDWSFTSMEWWQYPDCILGLSICPRAA